MHVLWRDGLQDDDYLHRYCVGGDELRDRALREYPPSRVAEITGIAAGDIERLAHEYGTTTPALIRLNYGMQRHAGGGMAVRTITCLPAIIGAWRQPGGGALLSTSMMYPFNAACLERPDLIRPGTRTVNMVHLAEALNGELPGPPIRALCVYNSNPAAVCPDQSRVLEGLKRDDLFTVVLEQFPTDTVDYADVVLPATTQLEHWDVHGSYGHLYVQVNEPAIAPLGEAKPNTEIFRLLARRMGFEPELFETPDQELIVEALTPPSSSRRFPPPEGFAGIDFDRLRREGPIRIDVRRDFAPFAEGGFDTPSGKCELFSAAFAARGFDPLPTYTPPFEDPQTRPDLASRFPLQMVSPPAPQFVNSTFVNIGDLRKAAGEPTVEIHAEDARRRGIRNGQLVRVHNDRGSFQARALVGETVKPGVVVSQGIWWNKYATDGVNCNTTTSTRLTDLGEGATFFDNLVEVSGVPAS